MTRRRQVFQGFQESNPFRGLFDWSGVTNRSPGKTLLKRFPNGQKRVVGCIDFLSFPFEFGGNKGDLEARDAKAVSRKVI